MSKKRRGKGRKRARPAWPEGEVTIEVSPGKPVALPGEAAGRTIVASYATNPAGDLLMAGIALGALWFAVTIHWLAAIVVAGVLFLSATAPRSMRIDASTVTIRRWIGEKSMSLAEAERLSGAFSELIRLRRLALEAETPHACQTALEWLLVTREGRTHQALEKMSLMLDVFEEAGTGPVLLLAVKDGEVEPLDLSKNWALSEAGKLHPFVRRIRKAAAKAAIVAIPRTTELDFVRVGERLVTSHMPLGADETTAIVLADECDDAEDLSRAFAVLGLEPATKGMKVVRGRASRAAA